MVKIRDLVQQDLDEAAELEAHNFADPWKRNDFEELIGNPDKGCIVAEDEGRIVGLAVYRNILGDVDITNVQVRTGHRRQGIGRSIVEKAVSKARETGGRNYTLEVRASNTDAIRLYEALGFKTEGIRKGFYDHPKEDAIIMWLRDG